MNHSNNIFFDNSITSYFSQKSSASYIYNIILWKVLSTNYRRRASSNWLLPKVSYVPYLAILQKAAKISLTDFTRKLRTLYCSSPNSGG